MCEEIEVIIDMDEKGWFIVGTDQHFTDLEETIENALLFIGSNAPDNTTCYITLGGITIRRIEL